MTSNRRGNEADLLAALSTPHINGPGRVCKTGVILSTVSAETRDRVLEIITELRAVRESGAESQYTARWLAQTLSDNGHPISQVSLGHHIRRGCRCDR